LVVVTGASGHLGTVLVRALANRSEKIRYLTRNGVPPGLEGIDAEPFAGDLFDLDRLAELFTGARVVYHSAAKISILPGDETELHRVNAIGTRNVLEAAKRAGAGRLVYVGSVEAFPLENDIRPITEDAEIDPSHTVMEYGRSKAQGILEVLNWADGKMDCVVCCPTGFVGPPDYRRSPMGQMVLDFINRRLPVYIGGGFDFVDVRDVAGGLIKAAEAGQNGRTYLLSGHFATVPEIMDMLERVSGVRKPRLCLPVSLLRPVMPVVESYYRLSGRSARYTRNSLKLLSLNVRVDAGRARSELGYDARPLEQTLADTVRWFRSSGMTDKS
jgi:dihydroflavonol-4-reductase